MCSKECLYVSDNYRQQQVWERKGGGRKAGLFLSTSLWPLQKCCWTSFRPSHEVPHLPTQWRATLGKGSDFLRVCTVLDAIGETQKSSLARALLPPRPRAMENMRYQELWECQGSWEHS